MMLNESNSGRRNGVLLGLLWLLWCLPHGQVGARQLTKAEQTCVNKLDRNLAKVAKIQGGEVIACLANASRGKLSGTIEDCLTADVRGKLAKAMAKTRLDESKKCTGLSPPFGFTDSATINHVAATGEVLLIHRSFGADLDAAIILASANKAASICQQAVAKSLKKCRGAKLKGINKCIKDGLKDLSIVSDDGLRECMGQDPKGKISRACDKPLASKLDKKCAGIDIADTFPGECSGSTDLTELGDCLSRILEFCGDGIVQPSLGEDCDSTNGCTARCAPVEVCGNDSVGLGEECDDGNSADGDGCSMACILEFCGDGVVQLGLGEECDDGNNVDGDGCRGSCKREFCGDRNVQSGLGEECDDGGTADGDGCSDTCIREPGAVCEREGTSCVLSCGEGTIDLAESCDDANLIGGDGCSSACELELGAVCQGEPSVCAFSCGNGVLDEGEVCDDGNLTRGDGCNANCREEFCGDGTVQPPEQCDPFSIHDLNFCLACVECAIEPVPDSDRADGIVDCIGFACTDCLVSIDELCDPCVSPGACDCLGLLPPNSDGDGIPNEYDACPTFGNTLPLRDTNGDNIPDDCQCGDANGDGELSALDARRLNQYAAGIGPDSFSLFQLADASGNGPMTALDSRLVNQVVQGLKPTWQLKCGRRMEGTEPPDISLACALPGINCEL